VSVTVERLRAAPLFAALTDEELATVGSMFVERHVLAGDHVISEGASGYMFFVIEDGTVDIERDGAVVNTLGPGEFFGESAIISGERRNATVTATSEVRLLALFGTEFRVLEQDWPAIADKIKQTMAERSVAAPTAE